MTVMQGFFFYSMLAFFACMLVAYTTRLIQLLRMSLQLGQYRKNEQYADHGRFIKSENAIPVSIIVPACNEAETIVDTVRNLLSLHFQEYEIIVVNDGSTDNSLLQLKLEYELIALRQPYRRSLRTQDIKAIYRSPLYANLVVVNKVHGGKADAINAGINIANYPVVVTVGADCRLEKDALVRLIMPFVNDFRVVSVSSMARAASGWRLGQQNGGGSSSSPLGCLQTMEYLRTYLTGSKGSNIMGMGRILSGAFGAFNKASLIDIGGFTEECMEQTLDATMRLHKHMLNGGRPYAIRFIAAPLCWRKAPSGFGELLRQRRAWQVQMMDFLRCHKDMHVYKPAGALGIFTMPGLWIATYVLPMMEALCYLCLLLACLVGSVTWLFALSAFLMLVFYGVIISIGTLLLQERAIAQYDTAKEMLRLVLFAFLENMGYRQINAWMCVYAMFGFKKRRQDFQEAGLDVAL